MLNPPSKSKGYREDSKGAAVLIRPISYHQLASRYNPSSFATFPTC